MTSLWDQVSQGGRRACARVCVCVSMCKLWTPPLSSSYAPTQVPCSVPNVCLVPCVPFPRIGVQSVSHCPPRRRPACQSLTAGLWRGHGLCAVPSGLSHAMLEVPGTLQSYSLNGPTHGRLLKVKEVEGIGESAPGCMRKPPTVSPSWYDRFPSSLCPVVPRAAAGLVASWGQSDESTLLVAGTVSPSISCVHGESHAARFLRPACKILFCLCVGLTP